MGIDACIFCRTTDGKRPELCDGLPVGAEIVSAEGIRPKGSMYEISTCWRYYGPGHERGPWPMISAALMALYACKNVEAVWYYSDCCEVSDPFTQKELLEFSSHYMTHGDRPYRS